MTVLEASIECSDSAFTRVFDKSLPSNVNIASWCPSMDLVALITDDGQLHVHRLNWQRLWTVPSLGSPVTSLTWRPDGKQLMLGHVNGQLSLLSVESGEVIYKFAEHGTAVAALCWVTTKPQDSEPGYEYRMRKFFWSKTRASTKTWAAIMSGSHNSGFSVCTSADINMKVHVAACIQFPLLQFQPSLPQHITSTSLGSKSLQSEVFDIWMAADFATIITMFNMKAGSNDIGTAMYISNTSCTRRCECELEFMAKASVDINAVISVCNATLQTCEKLWSKELGSMASRMQQLQQQLDSHDVTGFTSAADEFVTLLASGAISEAMHQFIASDLGEVGLKALAKAIDAALYQMHEAVRENVMPCLEIIVFIISDLRGAVMTADCLPHHDFMIKAEALEAAAMRASKMLLCCERMRLMLSDVAGQYRVFFAWLLRTLRQLNDQNTAWQDSEVPMTAAAPLILRFLDGQFERDTLLPLFSNNDSHPSTAVDVSDDFKSLMAAMWGEGESGLPQCSLLTQLQQLTKHMGAVLYGARDTLSPQLPPHHLLFFTCSFSPASSWRCKCCCVATYTPPPQDDDDGDGAAARNDNGGDVASCSDVIATAACCNGTSPSQLYDKIGIWRFNATANASEMKVRGRMLQLPRDTSVIAAKLYKPGLMVLLLRMTSCCSDDASQHDDATSACIVLLRIGDIEMVPLTRGDAGQSLVAMLQRDARATMSWSDVARHVVKCRACTCALDNERALQVSPSRGLALVLASTQRVVCFDLEEDEGADDDDDDDDEDDDDDDENSGGNDASEKDDGDGGGDGGKRAVFAAATTNNGNDDGYSSSDNDAENMVP